MSKIRATTYTFDASSKTIDCALFTSLEAIQLITNVTDNIIIYNFADATKGGTLSGTVLTLAYDTTSMSDTDKLQILVEDGNDPVKAEDSAHTSGDKGVFVLAVRNSDNSVLAGTQGDYSPIAVNDTGTVYVDIRDGYTKVHGNVSAEDPDSGEPVKVGGKYNSTLPTYTDGDRTNLQTDSRGRLKVDGSDVAQPVGINAGTNAIGKLLPPDIDVTTHTNYAKKYYTNAGAVTDGIVWSPAAGKRWHVVSMFIQTSLAATITLEDDKAVGDEVVWKAELAANGGMTINFSEKYPLASGEDAADLLVTTSAGNIYITITGYEI